MFAGAVKREEILLKFTSNYEHHIQQDVRVTLIENLGTHFARSLARQRFRIECSGNLTCH